MYCAGIVTYNPDITRLVENINAIYNQVDNVIIVDNNSKNIAEIEQIVLNYLHICLIKSKCNEGIATALNKMMKKAKELHYTWCLTLDQDSIVPENIIEDFSKYVNIDVGIISPLIDYHNNEDLKLSNTFDKIDRCITSASLTNVNAWEKIGGFDDKMFIDYVDYDFCKRLKMNNYSILRSNAVIINHSLGNVEKKHFLKKEISIYNHIYMRTFYFSRNYIYYIRKNCTVKEGLMEIKYTYRWFLIKIIFEKHRLKKLHVILKGFYNGFKMKI